MTKISHSSSQSFAQIFSPILIPNLQKALRMIHTLTGLCLVAAAAANTPMPHPDMLRRSLAEMAKRSLVGAGCDQNLGGTDFK